MPEPIYEILADAMKQYEAAFPHGIPMSAQESWYPNKLLGRLNKALLERKPIPESEFTEAHYGPFATYSHSLKKDVPEKFHAFPARLESV